ncbi:AAA family ATPase [Solirubrobacter taibaiensis]|nr:AAA family ATPase [Solirubrobacter taibaiensis]
MSRTLPTTGTLVGRDAQLEALRGELHAASTGRARFALIEGQAGMGKTTLLNTFIAAAEETVVVRANGVESETEVEFGVLDQLLRHSGFEAVDLSSEDHVHAGMSLLHALDQLESRTPVIVVVEDVHWVDAASLRTILFAARRLVSERVLMLMSVREEASELLPSGLRVLASGGGGITLRTEPLSVHETRDIAAARGIWLSPRVAEQLRSHTGGSPLYITALLTEVPADRWEAPDGSWPAPRSYSALVLRRADTAPEHARRLIDALAILGISSPLDGAATLAEVSAPLEAVESATRTGLVLFDEHADELPLQFDHPLTRAAIYHGMGPATRARLHARAATLVDTEAAALRHRVAATAGADNDLAAALETHAAAARARGAWSAASGALLSASRLSASAQERERLLLEAAEASLYGSEPEQAQRLLPEVERLHSGPLRDGVLAFAAITQGRGDEAERLLTDAWDACDVEHDRALAAKLAERRAWLGILMLRANDAVDWGRRAVQASLDNDVTVPLSAWSLVLGLDQTGRSREARAILDASDERLGSRLRTGGYPLADVRGRVLLACDALEEARDQLLLAAPLQVSHGVLTKASFAYGCLARAEFGLGAWDEAVVHAELAVALADEASDAGPRSHALQAAMLVPTARGLMAEAATIANELADLPLVFANHGAARRIGLAHHAAAAGDAHRVLTQLRPLAENPEQLDVDDPGYWPWHSLYVDALIDTESFIDATRFLAAHEDALRGLDRPSMSVKLARARGRLAWRQRDLEAGLHAFSEALERVSALAMPYERALVELELGQVLRRDGQRKAASEHLLAAKARLQALGAAPHLQRCDAELEASGLRPVRRGDDVSRDALTPRERAVSRLAAAGKSNREIAAELMLSVKTVENHLTRVFAKRGVRSRSELPVD